MPEPTITISCLHYEWETIQEAFDRAQNEFGLDGVEWSWPHPKLSEEDLGLIRALSAETGMDISVHVWGNLAQLGVQAGVEQMGQWLLVCETAGFSEMIVHGGSHDDQQAGIEITRDIFGLTVDEFERAGVTVCLENHYAYEYHDAHELFSTPEEFLQVFEAIDSPALGFLLDYGHSEMTKNTADLLEQLAPWLKYTHLADNMGVDDDHLAFGYGTVPWREILEKTRSVGYPGPFTVEFPVREGVYDALPRCVEMLRDVFGGQ